MARPGTDMPNTNSGFISNDDVIQQSKFEFDTPRRFRIFGIMVPYREVWYQSKGKDEEGNDRQVARTVRLPLDYKKYGWSKEYTIFDALQEIDKKIQISELPPNADPAKVRSIWTPRSKYVFACFDRDEEVPTIRFLETSYSIFKQIKALQEKADEIDQSKLAHGPIWIGDIVITKKEDQTKTTGPAYQRISYDVSTSRTNKFQGEIDIRALKGDDTKLNVGGVEVTLDELYDKSVKWKIFTQEEKDLFDGFEEEKLVNRYKPQDNAAIGQLMLTAPLALDATDQNGSYLLANPEKYVAKIEEAGANYAMLSNETADAPDIPAPPDNAEEPPEFDAKLDPKMKVDTTTEQTKEETKEETTTEEKIASEADNLDAGFANATADDDEDVPAFLKS